MSTAKSAGATKLGRDSISKRLGVKLFGGEKVEPGNIIIRQRGNKFIAGVNVKRGNDDTLYSKVAGKIKFTSKRVKGFNGKMRNAKVVHVLFQETQK